MTTALIEFSNVTFSFERNKPIVSNFCWTVFGNMTIAVVGLSGCGKSTFIRLLYGALRPSCGSIRLCKDIEPSAGGSFGLVLQEDGLYPWRTILSNLQLGIPHPDKMALRERLVEFGINPSVQDQYPSTLSVGMRKRVEIIRACAVPRSLVLADEPFSALDTQGRETAKKALQAAVTDRAGSLIIVSHDLIDMVEMAHCFVVFRRDAPGRLLVLENPARGADTSEPEAVKFRIKIARAIGAI